MKVRRLGEMRFPSPHKRCAFARQLLAFGAIVITTYFRAMLVTAQSWWLLRKCVGSAALRVRNRCSILFVWPNRLSYDYSNSYFIEIVIVITISWKFCVSRIKSGYFFDFAPTGICACMRPRWLQRAAFLHYIRACARFQSKPLWSHAPSHSRRAAGTPALP